MDAVVTNALLKFCLWQNFKVKNRQDADFLPTHQPDTGWHFPQKHFPACNSLKKMPKYPS
jgi:hypothetical protein